MLRLNQSGVVWSLLLCLVLVNGFLVVPAVAHADHHAKHEAGTHSTGLCAWQCAAGQSLDTQTVSLSAAHAVLDRLEFHQPDRVEYAPPPTRLLRGPPSFLR